MNRQSYKDHLEVIHKDFSGDFHEYSQSSILSFNKSVKEHVSEGPSCQEDILMGEDELMGESEGEIKVTQHRNISPYLSIVHGFGCREKKSQKY